MAPISNDLLLAAALTGAVPAGLAQTPASAPDANRPRTGVATTVTTNPQRGSTSTTMYIDGTSGQRLTTDANSTLHVLFSDQSAVTIGPNSELVIARYEFDPKAKSGQILIDLTKGLLRVVGGLISKKTAAQVRTSTATIGIRGGISIVSAQADKTDATFLFGIDMRVTGKTDGNDGSGGADDTNVGDNTGSGQSGPPGLPGGAIVIATPGFSVVLQPGQNILDLQPVRTSTSQLAAYSSGFGQNTPPPPSPPAPSPPAPSPPSNRLNTLVNNLSPTRQSNPTGINLVTRGANGSTGGSGGPPTLNQLIGTTQLGNKS
jgi:hypothetical protein